MQQITRKPVVEFAVLIPKHPSRLNAERYYANAYEPAITAI